MGNAVIEEIKTELSVLDVIAHFSKKSNCAILETSLLEHKGNEISIIAAEPSHIIKSKGNAVELYDIHNNAFKRKEGNPFDELEILLNSIKTNSFWGVELVIGYFGYDLCHFIERLPRTAIDDVAMPDMYFGVYDCHLIVDHSEDKLLLVYSPNSKEKADRYKDELTAIEKTSASNYSSNRLTLTDIKSNFSKSEYISAIEKAKEYIYAGDIYQVNLSQRFFCKSENTPLELYMRLRDISPSPYSCLIQFDDCAVISSSPERFFKVHDGVIQTRPIKGTRGRGANPEEDKLLEEELMNSEKDNAELAMIVDLERNDLGKICEYNTVQVVEPKVLEKYSTVIHLVSTIEGKLRKEVTLANIMKAVFPGGSITGCPKVRAMEIIDEFEPTQRGVYTGAIGMIKDDYVDMSIAIRILVKKGDNVYFQVGGGIVADSEPEKEYEETMIKAKALIKTLTGVSV